MMMQQQQHSHSFNSNNNYELTSPRSYTLQVLPSKDLTTSSNSQSTSSYSKPMSSPLNNDLFLAMTMNPRKYVPRPPAEIRIRASSPTTTRNNSTLSSSSDLNKALPPPPAPQQQQKANGTTKRTAAIFKGLKTRLRTHSFSSSTFSTSSNPQAHHHFFSPSSSSPSTEHRRPSTGSSSLTGPSSPIHAHANESVAQEYARTIKSLWKMVEDEEQAHRLVEASHSLSGCIPTIADINFTTSSTSRPFGGTTTMPSALRRPSLPLLMTTVVTPIQEEEETSTTSATTPTRRMTTALFSSRSKTMTASRRHTPSESIVLSKTLPLPLTTTITNTSMTATGMENTVADLDISPVGCSDVSASEGDDDDDSEEDEERAVVHVAQKLSLYRGRSFCWSQPA
ncbi:MAG: hypothetical protein J3R72DRAFT_448054 [Linnemannia gamsii]|nr:MAG: hypothetical protein J3R72DRAFT_448054 [Linnemannia gamsii]